MFLKRLGIVGLVAGLGLGAAGCSDYGYGYGGLDVGYASAGGYGDPYYDGYGYGGGYGGYGYAPSYFGWYNDFYYPGTGGYVYDRNRRPFRWNDTQRQYWQGRAVRGGRQNWGQFQGNGGYRGDDRQGYRGDGRPGYRGDGRRDNPGYVNPGNPGQRGDGRRGGYRGGYTGQPGVVGQPGARPDRGAYRQQQRADRAARGQIGRSGGGSREGRNPNEREQ